MIRIRGESSPFFTLIGGCPILLWKMRGAEHIRKPGHRSVSGRKSHHAWRHMKGDDDEEVDALGNMQLDSVCPLVRLFFALCFCGNRDADVYSDAGSLCRLDELLEPVIKHIKESAINFSCW